MKYLDFLPYPLLEDIVENRCIPIIGAGFSKNAATDEGLHMPLWNEVAEHFSKQLGENYSYANPLDPISDFCFKFGKAKVVEQLRRILHTGKVKTSPVHQAFAHLPFDIVITTNFDFLLERAYEQIVVVGLLYVCCSDIIPLWARICSFKLSPILDLIYLEGCLEFMLHLTFFLKSYVSNGITPICKMSFILLP